MLETTAEIGGTDEPPLDCYPVWGRVLHLVSCYSPHFRFAETAEMCGVLAYLCRGDSNALDRCLVS